jgi:hypothetical protein
MPSLSWCWCLHRRAPEPDANRCKQPLRCLSSPEQASPRPASPFHLVATHRLTPETDARRFAALALPSPAMPLHVQPCRATPNLALWQLSPPGSTLLPMYHRLITALALPVRARPSQVTPCPAMRAQKSCSFNRVREGLGHPPDKISSSFIPNFLAALTPRYVFNLARLCSRVNTYAIKNPSLSRGFCLAPSG